MARPAKLTPEVRESIVQAIEAGATYDLACKFAGISYQTFRNWIIAAEEGKNGAIGEFYAAVNDAEGRAALKWLQTIDRHSDVDWRAAAWKLERRYPNEFGKTVQEQQITGKDGGAIQIIGIEIPKQGQAG